MNRNNRKNDLSKAYLSIYWIWNEVGLEVEEIYEFVFTIEGGNLTNWHDYVHSKLNRI